MRNTLSVITLALSTTLLFGNDVNAGASSPKETASKLLAESRTARQTATMLADQLKKKNADLSKVSEHIANVEQSASNIQSLLAALEGSGVSMNERQRASLDTSKKLAELMNVFVSNKKSMVADGASGEEREMLRAQALGAAKRAELIEKNVMQMGL